MIRYCVTVIALFTFTSSTLSQLPPQNSIDKEWLLKNEKARIEFSQQDFQKQVKSKNESVVLPYLGNTRAFKVIPFSIYGTEKNPYPEIKTYKLRSPDGSISGRITDGPAGTFISYFQNGKIVRIYPDLEKSNVYYQEIGISRDEEHVAVCNEHGEIDYTPTHDEPQSSIHGPFKTNGSVKRVYRVAIICTGEYYQANGGNTTVVRQLAIANLSDISAIYEIDLAVELIMAPGSPRIESDPNTDPFIPDNAGGQPRTVQAQEAISDVFASSRYEIGHVFHNHTAGDNWSSGGLAGLGVVCDDDRKASGWSGSFSNTGNGFIQLAAHEFGHQFNATHTFNGIGGSCDTGNHPISTAYEIGSGTTIMSYQGLCDADQNIASSGIADNYFHINSLERMVNYMENFGVCNESAWIPDNNNPPVVEANPCGAAYNLPRQTPFFLTGAASDIDGDILTYSWEGYDEDGPSTRDTHGDIGQDAANTNDAPLWRSFPPMNSPTRYFPDRLLVKDNARSDFEVLPNRKRDMKMRLTVRDNNPAGGAIDWEEISINVESTMGPLQVTAPNGGELINAGEDFMVTWNPRNSESMCANAAIRLSLDGGATFPFTLASEVDYGTGSAMVTLPASFTNSQEAKIMVACDDFECFQWYDMSNNTFSIESNCFAPGNRICDISPLEAEFGDPQLDLGLDIIKGSPILSYSGSVANVPPTMPVAVNDFNGNCLRLASANNAFDTLRFVVTESGSYTFEFNTDGANKIKAYTIFDADGFDSGNACPSFIESNARFIGNSFGFFTSMTVELDACKEYLLASQITNADTRDIDLELVTGPGSVIEIDYSPDYSTAVVAVDPVSETILFVSTSGDLTTLEAGTYHVYSATFKSTLPSPPEIVDPQNWIGLTTTELLNSGDCFRLSENFKEVTIISTCTVFDLEILNQTPCDPLGNVYSQTIKFKIDKGPLLGTIMINGQIFPVTPDSMEVTLLGLLADGEPVDLSFEFSEDASCSTVIVDAFIAPENCCPIDINFPQGVINACEGEEVILDAGDDGITYQWFMGANLLAFNGSQLAVDASGNYTVIVTDLNTCAKSRTVTVNINPLPDLEISEDVMACIGDTIEINAESTADSLLWQNAGVDISTMSSFNITASGEYIVTAVNEFGCESRDTLEADFAESPEIELGEDQVLCQGDTLVLTAGDPSYFYGWVKDGVQLPESGNTLEVTEDGDYIVVAVNTNQCETIDRVMISFRELPDLELGSDITACSGDTVILQANANGFDVEWFMDSQLIADADGDSLAVTQNGSYRALVSSGPDCFIDDEVSVIFNPRPVVDLGDDRVLCEGSQIDLIAGADSEIHVWLMDGTELMNTGNVQTVVTGGVYSVNVVNEFDCQSTDTVSIAFNALPELELGTDTTLCANELFTIEAITNGFGIEWYLDGNLVAEADSSALSADVGGQYVARIFSGEDCATEDTINITYNPVPVSDLGGDQSACEGETITFEIPGTGPDFSWYLNGMLMQEGTDNSFSVTTEGTVVVETTNLFNCSVRDTANAIFIEMPEVILDNDFAVCAGDTFTLQANTNVAGLEWFLNGNLLDSETGLSLVTNQQGQYVAVAGTGGICEDRDTINVQSVPIPEFDIIGPSEACEDEQLILEVNLETDESIEWYQDGLLLDMETNASLEVHTSGTYSARVSNTTGCTSEKDIEVTIYALADVVLSNIPTLCEGEILTVEVMTDAASIRWEDANGIIPGADQSTLDISESGSYSIVGLNEIGCETRMDFMVDFSEVPTIDLGERIAACDGETVLLEVEDNPDYSYEWYRDNNIIQGENEATLEVTTSGIYSVEVVTPDNCMDSSEVEVSFNPPPSLAYSGSVEICDGEIAELEIETDATSIEWSFDGAIIATGQTSIEADKSGLYSFNVSSDEGCALSGEIELLVNSNPVIMIQDVELCPGESQLVSVDQGFSTYTWTGINANGSEAEIQYQMVTGTETELAGLMVTDSNGCTASDEFVITYYPVLEASVEDEVVEICTGDQVQLQAEGGLFYEWNDPNGSLSSTTVANPVASPGASTIYNVTITDNCPNNMAILDVEVMVNVPPEASAGPDTCVLAGVVFELNASGGLNYAWDNTGLIIGSSLTANASAEIETATTFTVTVTDENGCTDTDQVDICIVEDPSSILDAVTILTPNGDGMNDQLEFRGLEAFPENKLTIFNRWGNVIYEKVGYQRDELRWEGLRNGLELPADTYYYILEFAEFKLKTSLTIIRD